MWLEASLYPSHANTPKFFYVILFCSLGFCRHISPIPVSYLQDPSFILGVNEASSPNLCDTGSCITMACVLKAKNLYLRSLSSGLYICPWGGGLPWRLVGRGETGWETMENAEEETLTPEQQTMSCSKLFPFRTPSETSFSFQLSNTP